MSVVTRITQRQCLLDTIRGDSYGLFSRRAESLPQRDLARILAEWGKVGSKGKAGKEACAKTEQFRTR